jgi:CheY-like chemotaxis protein
MKSFLILIAEDDPDDRFLLKKAFEENGIDEHIAFVENGDQVMNYLGNLKNTTQQFLPRLILLDLNMPKKDGKQVLKEIKEHPDYKKIPVVVFTTSRNELVIDKCYELGANTYIIKPISFDGLLKIVERIKTYWMQTAAYLQ